jgi:hypothetical protein
MFFEQANAFQHRAADGERPSGIRKAEARGTTLQSHAGLLKIRRAKN